MPASTPEGRFRGLLYRALNPVWARQPLSGAGAARHGGRFNARGTPALYCSLRPETAIRESNQIGTLQPTVLVAIEADTGPVLDGTDAAALAGHGATPALLADPGWRRRMLDGQPVPTQILAARLTGAGIAGLIVPSFARGAGPSDLNLVLWRLDGLRVVDDDDRLSRAFDPAGNPPRNR